MVSTNWSNTSTNSTNYTTQTTNSTAWGPDDAPLGNMLQEDGYTILLQDGANTLAQE